MPESFDNQGTVNGSALADFGVSSNASVFDVPAESGISPFESGGFAGDLPSANAGGDTTVNSIMSFLADSVRSLGDAIKTLAGNVLQPSNNINGAAMNYAAFGGGGGGTSAYEPPPSTMFNPISRNSLSEAGRFIGRPTYYESFQGATGGAEDPFVPRMDFQSMHSDDFSKRTVKSGMAATGAIAETVAGGGLGAVLGKAIGKGLVGTLAGGAIGFTATSAAINGVMKAADKGMEFDTLLKDVTSRAGINSDSLSPGLDSSGREKMARRLQEDNPDLGLGDLTDILMEGSSSGLFEGVSNPDELEKVVSSAAKNVKALMKVIKSPDVQSAIQDMSMFKSWGIGLNNQQDFAYKAEAVGRELGVTAQGAIAMAQQGAQTGLSMGYTPAAGAAFGLQTQMIGESVIRSNSLSAAQKAMYGGAEGVGQRIQEGVMGSSRTAGGQGLLVASLNEDGSVDRDFLRRMQGGKVSFDELTERIRKNKANEKFKKNNALDIMQNPEMVVEKIGTEEFMNTEIQAIKMMQANNPDRSFAEIATKWFPKHAAKLIEQAENPKAVQELARMKRNTADKEKTSKAIAEASARSGLGAVKDFVWSIPDIPGELWNDYVNKPVGNLAVKGKNKLDDALTKYYTEGHLGVFVTAMPQNTFSTDLETLQDEGRSALKQMDDLVEEGNNTGMFSKDTVAKADKLRNAIDSGADPKTLKSFTADYNAAMQKDITGRIDTLESGDSSDKKEVIRNIDTLREVSKGLNISALKTGGMTIVSQQQIDKKRDEFELENMEDWQQQNVQRHRDKTVAAGNILEIESPYLISELLAGGKELTDNKIEAMASVNLDGIKDIYDRMDRMERRGGLAGALKGSNPQTLSALSAITGISVAEMKAQGGEKAIEAAVADMEPEQLMEALSREQEKLTGSDRIINDNNVSKTMKDATAILLGSKGVTSADLMIQERKVKPGEEYFRWRNTLKEDGGFADIAGIEVGDSVEELRRKSADSYDMLSRTEEAMDTLKPKRGLSVLDRLKEIDVKKDKTGRVTSTGDITKVLSEALHVPVRYLDTDQMAAGTEDTVEEMLKGKEPWELVSTMKQHYNKKHQDADAWDRLMLTDDGTKALAAAARMAGIPTSEMTQFKNQAGMARTTDIVRRAAVDMEANLEEFDKYDDADTSQKLKDAGALIRTRDTQMAAQSIIDPSSLPASKLPERAKVIRKIMTQSGIPTAKLKSTIENITADVELMEQEVTGRELANDLEFKDLDISDNLKKDFHQIEADLLAGDRSSLKELAADPEKLAQFQKGASGAGVKNFLEGLTPENVDKKFDTFYNDYIHKTNLRTRDGKTVDDAQVYDLSTGAKTGDSADLDLEVENIGAGFSELSQSNANLGKAVVANKDELEKNTAMIDRLIRAMDSAEISAPNTNGRLNVTGSRMLNLNNSTLNA